MRYAAKLESKNMPESIAFLGFLVSLLPSLLADVRKAGFPELGVAPEDEQARTDAPC